MSELKDKDLTECGTGPMLVMHPLVTAETTDDATDGLHHRDQPQTGAAGITGRARP